jgi:SAM-dependent methyltransferase
MAGTGCVSADQLRARSRLYYEAKLRQHGPSPRGVDWNSRESQELRFRQLARLIEDRPEATVLDYGCGVGALGTFLRAGGHRGRYVGYDVSPAMIEEAQRGIADCVFTSDRAALDPADYTVASGVFNVKGDAADDAWRAYVLESIDDMRALSVRGFGFNLLTIHSDADRRRSDLYYADPTWLFEHCRQAYGRWVALLHDYGLYEFTLLVRLSV